MSATLDQFVKSVSDSGLVAADELREFQKALPPDKRPRDAQGLARELIVAGKLTKYQASAAYQGKAKSLVLGQYVILDRIGAGGMGQVYKAQHRRMKRVVALKVLPAAATKSPDLVKRFQREVEAAARLSHNNIVIAHDADEANGTHFLVMEFVDGIDLNALDKLGRPLTVAEALDYTMQAARGLAYAHTQGVVHRDIKPANLLLDKQGTVKILDMGLARIEAELGGGDGLTRSGDIMGTVDYMAPEQAEDTRRADHRSDIYSLGCTLYKILTGMPAYGGETLMSKMLAHRDQPIPSLRAARSDVSLELDAVFQRMIAKKPAQRYASMNEALAALESCRVGAAVAVGEPVAAVAGPPSLTNLFGSLTQVETAESKSTARGGVTLTGSAGEFAPPIVPLPPAARTSPPPLRPRGKSANQQLVILLAVGGGVATFVLVAGLVLFIVLGLGNKKLEAKKSNDKQAQEVAAEKPKKQTDPGNSSEGKLENGKPKIEKPPPIEKKPVVPPMQDEWVYLFNGKNIDGWQIINVDKSVWYTSGGLLTSRTGAVGSIFTTQEFDDFELELEFKLPAAANGGVFIRSPLQNDPSHTGLEIQLLDDYAPHYGNLKPEQYCGSIYDLVAASPRASKKAQEWQRLAVYCVGSAVQVRLNGALVVSTDLKRLSDKQGVHPGVTRKSGYIGLQNFGYSIEFRNLKIRRVAS